MTEAELHTYQELPQHPRDRRYGTILLSSSDIPAHTADTFNDLLRGFAVIDAISSSWERSGVTPESLDECISDSTFMIEILGCCDALHAVDRAVTIAQTRQEVITDLGISETDLRIVMPDLPHYEDEEKEGTRYTNIRSILVTNPDGAIELCKVGTLLTYADGRWSLDRSGNLTILMRQSFDFDLYQERLKEAYQSLLSRAREKRIDFELSDNNEQVLRSSLDVQFFREKFRILHHDISTPLYIISLVNNSPDEGVERNITSVQNALKTLSEVMELSHRLIHAQQEPVTIPSLKDGLATFAQRSADNQRGIHGYVQPVRVEVKPDILVVSPKLHGTVTIPDDAVGPFMFSRALLDVIVENCAKNTADALEGLRTLHPDEKIDPTMTIQFGISKKRDRMYMFIEDHGPGIPLDLRYEFKKRVSIKIGEGIRGTGYGMATLNNVTMLLFGNEPALEHLPRQVHPDSMRKRSQGARIVVEWPFISPS